MKKWPLPLLSFHLLLLFSNLLPPSIAEDTMDATTPLRDGQTLVSVDGNFALGFFSPGNSKNRYLGIWYNKVSVQTVVWVANRDKPVNDKTGVLKLMSNGTLILYSQAELLLWSANSSENLTIPIVQLLGSGNLVVKDAAIRPVTLVWQSFDHPCDTLLPGMMLGWNLKTGIDQYLTTWKSSDDPSPGDYTFRMDRYGSPEFFILDGTTKVYRNGPWNGVRFSGEPEMKNDDNFSFDFTSDSNEIYYSFQIKNNSVISRFMLNQSMIQRYVWLDNKKQWIQYWSIPRDPCDFYATCGPFGVCNSNDSPPCSCVMGFIPRSLQEWEFRDGLAGCVRRTSLDCPMGDGFLWMSGMKLPDTSNATVNQNMSLEDCRAQCLKTCTCTAYASAEITAGGSGCITWSGDLVDLREFVDGGQDLYIRLAASELGSSNKKKVIIIVVVTLVFTILLLCLGGYCIWKRKKNHDKIKNRRRRFSYEFAATASILAKENLSDDERSQVLELPLLDMDAIVMATENFSSANKIGEGGFGAVYKGDFGDGRSIAVKRLSKTSLQGVDEFKTEVRLIAKLQHVNLVRLLGCCIHEEERILIYEYMHNRSLDTIIFNKQLSDLLSWQKRFNIISGIARGLLYLHQDSRFRIIHRDLKASNILLDKEMNAKISDFGVARMCGGGQDGDYTKRVVGTYGYMSPEYAMDGIFSVKSDVYSFGVLVLEIISGKKNRGLYSTEPQLNLIGYIWRLWKEGNSLELIDRSIEGTYTDSEVLRCIQVGLLCVQESAEDRPHMSTVILMLGSPTAMLPQPKPPGFLTEKCLIDTSSSHTLNEITVTLLQGR